MQKMGFKLLLSAILYLPLYVQAQTNLIKGEVLDRQSDEPISFAAAKFLLKGDGVLTDSLGRFTLSLNDIPLNDTLQITSVGYTPVKISAADLRDSLFITVQLTVLPPQQGVIVKTKYNRALWFWRKIIAHKPENDKRQFNNYGYEVYNKLELDLDNINKQKLGKNVLLKRLNFVLSYVDSTSEKEPYLPVYLTETLSDYYYQREPRKTREVIKATITNGIDNESIIKQLGATYQNVDIYDNSIPVFNKMYVSPFSDKGDNFYNYKLLDTQYLAGKRLVHFAFTPKHPGGDMFSGDCWIHDTSFSVQKIMLRPSQDANLNFISGLTLIQEFKLVNDTTWFLYKDKFVADVTPIGKNRLGIKARKTTTYKNVIINSDAVVAKLDSNKSNEDILLKSDAQNKPDSFWLEKRHEPLNANEQTVYKVLDTLEKNKTYIHYRNTLNFLTTGTKDVGNVRIGPWYYWLSGDAYEGTRVRFDLATNRGFNDNLNLRGYLAYGFKDQAYKGKVEMKYLFSRNPWSYIDFYYKKDLDNGQVFYDQLGSDNVFSLFFRKPNIPYKYQQITEKKLEYYSETHTGFAVGLTASSREYQALLNLPGSELFPSKSGNPFNTFETGIRLRYAYQERIIEDNFLRTSLGSDYPIVDVHYTHGFPGVLHSSYTYDKLDISVSDYINIAPYGTVYYNFFAGKVFGTLPYQMLDILPGNDWYYYSKYSFNLMNRFEYLTDRYAGFNIEHNIGSGLFRYTRLTRKLKLRQFWEVKGVVGDLSQANYKLNFVGDYPFQSLNNKMYLEVGTGITNIFKFFAVDFIWRVLPTPLPQVKSQKFGVFFGFSFSL
ncbi:MAG: DUF5686 family protein [Parafilimonas sp.]